MLPLASVLGLAGGLLSFLNTPAGQVLVVQQVQTIASLENLVTGLVTQLLNGVHAGVSASAVVQTPVGGVQTGVTAVS